MIESTRVGRIRLADGSLREEYDVSIGFKTVLSGSNKEKAMFLIPKDIENEFFEQSKNEDLSLRLKENSTAIVRGFELFSEYKHNLLICSYNITLTNNTFNSLFFVNEGLNVINLMRNNIEVLAHHDDFVLNFKNVFKICSLGILRLSVRKPVK